jgi:predicted porin
MTCEHSQPQFRNSAPVARTRWTARLLAGSLCLAAGGAYAQASSSDAFSWNGVTFYGTIDAGIQFDNHGTGISDFHPAGFEEIIQKNSNNSVFGVDGNNLSQSKIGLRGTEALSDGWSGIFRLEIFFNPWSGELSDAEKSMTLANGVPLTSQSTAVDSSVAGQLLETSFVGFSHERYGSFTFGRQNGIVFDGIIAYDPMAASQAFSPIGFSGTASGGGATEDRRLDNSLKYELTVNSLHFGAQYQTKSGVNQGSTTELVLGWRFPGGAIDAYYMQKYDAIASAPLSAAQVQGIEQVCAGTATPAVAADYACASLSKALAGTVSDNTTYALMGKYAFAGGRALVAAGYEHIRYANPSNPLANGQIDIGGYVEAHVNDAAYPSDKILQISWVGLRYSVTPKLDITGAYYHYDQNSYSTAKPGCSSAAISAQCSGSEDFLAIMADYRLSRRFDIYAGAMWSSVSGGLANEFLNTSMIDPTIGVRFTF